MSSSKKKVQNDLRNFLHSPHNSKPKIGINNLPHPELFPFPSIFIFFLSLSLSLSVRFARRCVNLGETLRAIFHFALISPLCQVHVHLHLGSTEARNGNNLVLLSRSFSLLYAYLELSSQIREQLSRSKWESVRVRVCYKIPG